MLGEPLVRGCDAARPPVHARVVVAVAAEVGRDEREVRRAGRGREVAGQTIQRDVVGVAVGRVVDDRVEVDERVVARRVLVVDRGRLRVVAAVGRRVPARRRHVLHVALPRKALCGELVGDGLHGRRVDAALADRLAVGPDHARGHVGEELAVGLGLDVRRLPADHREVVRVAQVRGGVVLREQLALRAQRRREVRRRALEALGVVGVLEHDHPDVLDRRQRGAGRHGAGEQRDRGAERDERAPHAPAPASAFLTESGCVNSSCGLPSPTGTP